MMSSSNRKSCNVAMLFQMVALVEISLALAGVLCGIWGTATGKPGAVIVLVVSAAAAAGGLAAARMAPRLLEPDHERA